MRRFRHYRERRPFGLLRPLRSLESFPVREDELQDPYVVGLEKSIRDILEEHGALAQKVTGKILAKARNEFVIEKRQSRREALELAQQFVSQLAQDDTFNCIAAEQRQKCCAAIGRLLQEHLNDARIIERTNNLLGSTGDDK